MTQDTELREKIVIAVLQSLYMNPEYMKFLKNNLHNSDKEQADHSAMKAINIADATIKKMKATNHENL